ncbi:MAG: hypothetical protein N3D15_07225 [Syntrophorhabdaceae bacterium]|nr:hypothetical protein [Syntrophorhabdaceae bacterium]
MYNDEPTLEEWERLYKYASMFKEFAPWRWMDDSMLFGVQNPQNKEIGYCCVMGNLGEVFGVVVYLGNEGLDFFERLQSEEILPDNPEVMFMQRCLSLTFDDREYLDKRDMDIIKRLGLKFRGRQSWPLFRNYLPGYVPWFLTGSEVRYLTLVLPHVMRMGEILREDPNYLESRRGKGYLVMVPKEKDGGLKWSERWIMPEKTQMEKIEAPINEISLKKIKNKAKKQPHTWEVDFFYVPIIIKEGDRPYFPYLALYVEKESGQIINFVMVKHDNFVQEFSDNLFKLFDKINIIPQAIEVHQDAVYDFLNPITDRLDIDLKKTKSLKSLNMAKKGLINYLNE